MAKLYFNRLFMGLLYGVICSLPIALSMSLVSMIASIFLPFNIIVVLIFGAALSVAASFLFKGKFFGKNKYFLEEEISSDKKGFWLNAVRQKVFIKKKYAILSYVPAFILSASALVATIILYPLLSGTEVSVVIEFFWRTASGSALSSMTVSLFLYAIFGIKSLVVCKKCGTVNAFIYDNEDGFSSTDAVVGSSYNSPIGHHGMSWGGGGYNAFKVDSFDNRISCHCACCGEIAVLSEAPSDSKIIEKA